MQQAGDKRNILITSAGRRVALLRIFQHELRAAFPDAKVFTADCGADLAAAAHASDGSYGVPRVDDPAYVEALLKLSAELGVGMIVPTIDPELLVLAQHAEKFRSAGIHPIVSSIDLIRVCSDKRETLSFFEQHDIPVPRTVDRKRPTFPLFIKPFDGSSSQDTLLIESESELSPALRNDDRLMFVEAIDVRRFDEYTLDLYYDRSHTLRCVVPRKRLEVRGGEVSKGLTERNELCEFVRKRLGQLPGAVGCVTLQLFKHKEKLSCYGIEINPRFGGGHPLAYRAGANYAGWLIAEYYQDQAISDFDEWESNLLMLRYDDEILIHGYRDSQ